MCMRGVSHQGCKSEEMHKRGCVKEVMVVAPRTAGRPKLGQRLTEVRQDALERPKLDACCAKVCWEAEVVHFF